jgi:hypothetical protein
VHQQNEEQMTFAEFETLYSTIDNKLEGGVADRNQQLILQ